MRHFIAQQVWLLIPLCGIKDIWPRSIYLLVTVGANDGYLFVIVSTTFTFDIAEFKKSVCCQEFLAASVAMQYVKFFSLPFAPIKLLVAARASNVITCSIATINYEQKALRTSLYPFSFFLNRIKASG